MHLFLFLLTWDINVAVGIVTMVVPEAFANVYMYSPLIFLSSLRLASAQTVGIVNITHLNRTVGMIYESL